MTKTALENKRLAVQKEIEEAKLGHDVGERRKEREWKTKENKKDRIQRYVGDVLSLGGTIGKAALGGVLGGSSHKNDPQWYKRYITDLSEFTRLPTYERLGGTYYGTTYKPYHRGGICVLFYDHTVGPQSGTDISRNAINQILMRSKEMVLKLNSRSSVNWEPGDLGYNLLVTSTLLTQIGEIKRVLEVYRTYRGDNAYLAKALIQAMGINYPDLVSNIAEYRKNYTVLAKRFNESIVAPADLSLFHRKWYLAVNVFADKYDIESLKQIYFFKSGGHFKLNSSGTQLDYIGELYAKQNRLTTTAYSGVVLSALINEANACIQSITENPDFIEMYADLRAAFGRSLITVPEELDEYLAVNVDEMNRTQIHNIKTLPYICQVTNDNDENYRYFGMTDIHDGTGIKIANCGDIHQDNAGYIYQGADILAIGQMRPNPVDQGSAGSKHDSDIVWIRDNNGFTTPGTWVKTTIDNKPNALLDSSHVFVSGDMILDMTRLTISNVKLDNAYRLATESSISMPICLTCDCGTEVVYAGMFCVIPQYGDLAKYMASSQYFLKGNGTQIYNELISRVGYSFTFHTDFDWMFQSDIHSYDVNSGGVQMATLFEMDNAFVVDAKSNADIHTACVLSEFYLAATTFTGSGR